MTSFFNYHEYISTNDTVQTHHPNVYVEHAQNDKIRRSVRVPRDYSAVGDEYPYFSTHFVGEEPGAYPNEEGPNFNSRSPLKDVISYQEYNEIIASVNDYMRRAFSPWQKRQFVETVLSFLTFWIFERLFTSNNQRIMAQLDEYVDKLNQKNAGRFILINPRKNGFLSLDFLVDVSNL
ncbi:Ras modification protein [Yarrowia sp. B02]|nr:Ras modification protein [Yarrowia sp. B02]